MQNVGSGRRELNLHLAFCFTYEGQPHLRGTLGSLLNVDLNTEQTVHVSKLNFKSVVVERGRDLRLLGLSLVGDFDLLNGVLSLGRAVLTELSGKDRKANLALHKIGTRNFNENILGVKSDLGRL